MIRLSAINDEISDDLKSTLDVLKDCNIDYIELRKIDNRLIHSFTYKELKKFSNLIHLYGIEVSMLDSPIGKKIFDDIELFNSYIKIAKIFGTKRIRIFSNLSNDFLKKINELSKQNEISLYMENELNTKFTNIDYYLKLKDVLNLDNIFILYDNENYYRDNKEELLKYNRNIKYIHLRDFNKNKNKYEFLGKGDLRIKELIDHYERNNYNSFYSIESHLPMDHLDNKIEMFKKNIKNIRG